MLLFLLCFGGPVCADVTGPIRVIDGDTFQIGDERVRLFGVDAPEIGQPCTQGSDTNIDCGSWVESQVSGLFDGKTATCDGRERDRYDRLIATCYVDGADMGRTLVTAGLARAFLFYSDEYAVDEKGAAVAGRGIWQFTMMEPAAYRAEKAVAPPPPTDCIIKGNISSNGRIYHMPQNQDYSRTRINVTKGERYFCSETEALEAGWRPARN